MQWRNLGSAARKIGAAATGARVNSMPAVQSLQVHAVLQLSAL